MDDSAVVMARPGAGPDELAAVYDEHAAALYGYCRWLLPDPAQAVDALIEALASTTTRRDGPAEAGQLRARLYAAAREACRGHAAGTGAAATDEAAGDAADTAGLAEARRLLRDVLADMDQVTQQAAELSFRHQLDAAEIAIVLGVSPDQVGALTDRARQHLEKAVGALVVVRAGSSCPDLAALLAGQDETPPGTSARASSARRTCPASSTRSGCRPCCRCPPCLTGCGSRCSSR
jgi:RNA polymerase sigma factor (sigma-70 family)